MLARTSTSALIALAIILLAGRTAGHPIEASSASLPQSVTVPGGLIIAHGNELIPPYTIAVRGDTLSITDGAGRHLTSTIAPSSAADRLPLPRLLAPPAVIASENPEIRLAQIAHLLGGGGVVAFGRSYLMAFPPTSAATLLPDLRWVARNAVLVSDQIPQASPFFRDLMWPVELAPPSADRPTPPASSETLDLEAHPYSS